MKALKFLLLIFIIAGAASCKKSTSSTDTTPTYYIKATIDDTAKVFNVNAKAELDSTSYYRVVITGQQADGWMSIPAIKIETTPSRDRWTTGTYTNSGSDIRAVIQWQLTDSNPVYQSDETGSSSSDATIVITSISNTSVKGTFHGTLLLESGTGPATKVITNGEFNVPVQ